MPLVDFLSGIWGTLLLVGLGFIFIYRAVSARLPDFEQLAREEEAMKAYIEIQQELEEERKDNERFKKDMYAEMHDAEAVLAASLGYAYNENYGWVVGDHTVVTLAMEAARKLEPEDRR